MGAFNPTAGADERTPSFVGDSKGIRFDDARADTSLANLFEGLGEGLLMGVNAIDQGIQENIQGEINTGMDQLDADFGIDSAANIGDVYSRRNEPAAITDSMRHLEGLQQAREEGKLTESHYWARAQSLVRQLRGKYPGYRDVIDDKIGGITGVRPANALRRSLMEEWGQGAGDDQKLVISKINEMSKDGSLRRAFPDIDKRMAEGNLPSWPELILGQSAWQEEQAVIDRGRARLSVANEKGQLDQKEAARTFRQEVTVRKDGVFNEAVVLAESELGVSLLDMARKMHRDRSTGKPWAPEEAQQLGSLVEDARLQLSQVFDATLRDYVMEGIAPTPQEVDAARTEFMQQINDLEKSLKDKDTGGLHTFALSMEARKLRLKSDLIDRNPGIELTEVFKETVGSETLSVVLANEPEYMTAYAELHRRIMLNNAMLGDPNDPERAKSIREDLETIARDGQVTNQQASEITKATITGFVRTIEQIGSDKELPPQVLANHVEYMFGEEAFGATQHLSLEARKQFFSRVSSPQVTKKMMELRDNGRPELWEKYQKWVANEFKSQFQGDVVTVQNYVLNPETFDIQYDPQRMSFEFVLNPALSATEKMRIEHTGQVRVLEQTRRSINNAIQTIAPVIEANGMDPAEQIQILLTKEMGFDPDAAPEEQTVIDGMLDALQREFMTAAEDVRQGDLPLVGIRGAERMNKIGQGLTEGIRKSFWDLTAPFSPRFRSSEERRGTEQDAPANPALDQRLSEMKVEYPEAVKTLQSRAAPPKFEELGFMHRMGLASEAEKLGVSPQEIIDRAHALANPKKEETFKTPVGYSNPAELAANYLGLNEGNKEDQNTLSEFFKKYAGVSINPYKTAWCAAFANAVLGEMGIEGTGKLNAKSFLNFGTEVSEPEVGDIVVFDRGAPGSWQGHVGFFQGYDDKGQLLILGGNQGPTNKGGVSVKAYGTERLRGFRRPPTIDGTWSEGDKEVMRQIDLSSLVGTPIYSQIEMLEKLYA